MAHTITERPNEFCFSKNEIRYRYTVTDLTRAGLYFEVKIIAGAKEIVLPPLKPNADGSVIVYIQKYIDSLLTYTIPFANAITNAATQSVSFYIATREVTDAALNPAYTTRESTHVRTAVKAGIEKNRYGRNNFFVNYFNIQLPWLTWQPSNRMIALNEPVWLTALIATGTTNGMYVKTSWACTDGTTGTTNNAIPTQSGFVFHFKTDAVTLGVIAAIGVRQLYYYDVSIEVNTGSDIGIITNNYRFYIDYTHRYNTYDFIFTNSLSGIDCIRAVGEVAVTIERNYNEVEGGFSANEWNALIKGSDGYFTGITQRRNFKGDIGFRHTKQQQQALVEILVSEYIYQVNDSRLVPVLAVQKTQPLGKSTDTLFSYPIEWQLAESNEVFTPDFIQLGIGTDTEIY